MTMEYSGINESPTIDLLAASELTAPQGVALALSATGAALPAAGADAVGIALVSNPEKVAANGRVDVQISGCGLWKAGGAFDAGDLLATDAKGQAVKAETGNYVIARALETATAAGDLIKVKLINSGAKA